MEGRKGVRRGYAMENRFYLSVSRRFRHSSWCLQHTHLLFDLRCTTQERTLVRAVDMTTGAIFYAQAAFLPCLGFFF